MPKPLSISLAAAALLGGALLVDPVLAQTPAAAAPSPAAAEPEIVDLACTIAKGGFCRPGEECKPTDRIGDEPLPLTVTIDFDNRVVMSPVSRGYVSSSRVALLAHDQDQFMLHGIEHGFAWLMSIQETTRALSVTVTSVRGVFVGFGSCVPVESLQAKKN
jgi:hypothetical protein